MQLGLGERQLRPYLYHAVIVLYDKMSSIIKKIKINGAPVTSRKMQTVIPGEVCGKRPNHPKDVFLDWL